ncbi:MAG TPA: membrane protein insertion efficiency factor YidD [Thermoanaerobaculia bacterium]|jgi:putative membrane protein insertion efficiency factor|nr:membrane protein insertion efficiency factor YidD [Thermoanaerobaculia bacterium]
MGHRKGRRAVVIGLCALLLVSAQQLGTAPALHAIDAYRAHISPHLRGVVECRFEPTCSYYGRESIRKYGLVVGGIRTAWRIARCGPWTPLHTYDPP